MSNTYLGEFLAQLQHEGYSIFLVTGDVSVLSHGLIYRLTEPVCSAAPL